MLRRENTRFWAALRGTPQQWPLASFSIRPYENCVYRCQYCYLTKEFGASFGRFAKPIEATPDLIRRRRYALAGQSWMLSAHTDPYPPQEKRICLTRRCLEVLAGTDFETGVVATRATLVERDLDILLDLRDRVLVSLSITTDDAEVARTLEPGAAPPALRLRTARRIRQAGIRVRALVSPLLNHSSEFPRLLADASDMVFVDPIPEPAWTDASREHGPSLVCQDASAFVSELTGLIGEDRVFLGRASLVRRSLPHTLVSLDAG